ncbi:MAG TPA: hypothetical protein VHD62_06615 [Opitutaceae bacterium]|nr:hypothetical protein [Opitutaceae bacterium]
MLLVLARDWLLFAATVLVGGAALAPPRSARALEAWCVGIATALGVLGLGVFVTSTAALGDRWFFSGFVALAVVAVLRRRTIAAIFSDAEVREAALNWALVTAGGIFVLGCIVSYNGGAWMADWEEHYQRPLIFLRLRPEDELFRRLSPMTARPPLANLADAALLSITGAGYARHQVFMLLLNALAFLPAALFARTLGGGRGAIAWLAVLVLVNPMFLQNASYAWTKLITVFFVLTALHVLLTGENTPARVVTAFGVFALAVLAHYSACVWLLAFGGAWLVLQRSRARAGEFRKTLVCAALVFAALLAPWLAFAVARYGLGATFGSNSTVATGSHFTWWQNLLSVGPKLWYTLEPHTLRTIDRHFVAQANPWTLLRDNYFYLYQSNLFFGIGTPALVVLAALVFRRGPWPQLASPRVWWIAVPVVIVLGTAVHGHIDEWGVAHICLQPLILLAIALAAARLPDVFQRRRWLAGFFVAALALDFSLGIALHYAGTALALNRDAYANLGAYLASLSNIARYNLESKIRLNQDFFADEFGVPWPVCLAALVGVVLFAAARAWRLSRAEATPDAPLVKNDLIATRGGTSLSTPPAPGDDAGGA